MSMPPSNLALWLIVATSGGGAISNFANLGQLSNLNQAAREEVRVAEIRGQMQTDISTITRDLIQVRRDMNEFMLREGVIGLHDSQQKIIDDHRKIIDNVLDWMSKAEERYATKAELGLVKKLIEK